MHAVLAKSYASSLKKKRANICKYSSTGMGPYRRIIAAPATPASIAPAPPINPVGRVIEAPFCRPGALLDEAAAADASALLDAVA